MKNICLTTRKIILIAIIIGMPIFTANIKAQQFSTIHWLQGIPQSTYTNPAFQPDPNAYIGMPGLSGLHLGYDFTGFKPGDLLKYDSSLDKPFYWDQDNMLSKLSSNNMLGINYHHEILAFGFKNNRTYFSFNLTEKVSTCFDYSDDLFFFALKGNDPFRENDELAEFRGLGLDASHYREYAFGFSRDFTNEFNAGLRAKLLFGKANINFDRSDITLHTGHDFYALTLNSDMLVNMSQPFFNIDFNGTDDEGEETFMNVDDRDDFSVEDYLLNIDNLGAAFDIGFVYDIDGIFEFGLSVIDLGFINWKTDVSNYKLDGEFEFAGFDVDDFYDFPIFRTSDNNSNNNNNNDDDGIDIGSTLTDTLSNVFEFEETTDSYMTTLPTKVLLSGTYKFGHIHKAGLMMQGQFFKGTLYPSYTLAYSIQPVDAIAASLSYSIIHQNYTNIGLGFHFNIWPFQIYLVTDNFFPALQPQTIQHTTVQFGINWVIDYREYLARPLIPERSGFIY